LRCSETELAHFKQTACQFFLGCLWTFLRCQGQKLFFSRGLAICCRLGGKNLPSSIRIWSAEAVQTHLVKGVMGWISWIGNGPPDMGGTERVAGTARQRRMKGFG
jgi:hypothetical protein